MTTHAFTASGDASLVALRQVPLAAPAADEAVVAVEAFSVNRGEILLLEGGRADGHGKDVAGRVVAAAADGSGPPTGTRVVAHLERGGWAERVNVRAALLVALPDGVDAAAAAALPLPGLTALRLVHAITAENARRVLLTGASGGVGHLFCELAAARGVAVTAVARTRDRGSRLRAHRVVTSVAAAGGEFDVALDSVGGEVTGEALGALRPGGLLLWFGQASGRPAALDFFAVLGGPVDVRVQSFVYWAAPEEDARDLATLVDLAARDELHPEIGLTASWHDTPAVLAAVRDRAVRGSAVLEVAA
jgi:NADPH:quinone reductase-like Zn-dependent oxidoreductase